jgi:hypothetical protein
LTKGWGFEKVWSHAEQQIQIMRTKSMILGAALLAAGVASSMAQSNVYSLNVVGYINVPVVTGYNLIANNLDFDGTGTNNLMTNVLAGMVANNITFTVSKFDTNTAGFDSWQWSKNTAAWSDQTGTIDYSVATLNPGEAAFIQVTKASYSSNFTVVGQVLQGNVTNAYLPGGNSYAMVSSQFPLTASIDSTGNGGLNVPGTNTYSVYLWDVPENGYDVWQWNKNSQQWSLQAGVSNGQVVPGSAGQGPVISNGVGFFITTKLTDWTNSFTVQ